MLIGLTSIPNVKAAGSCTITYDEIEITVANGTTTTFFEDMHEADKVGTYELRASEYFEGYYDEFEFLDNQPRPCEWGGVRIFFNVTTLEVSCIIIVIGYEADPESPPVQVSETLNIGGLGFHNTEHSFRTVSMIKVSLTVGESITFSIFQSRWGVVWRNAEQFKIDCSINIINATISDKNKQVIFPHLAVTNIIEYDSDSWLKFGESKDASLKIGSEGVDFISEDTGICYFLFGQIAMSTGYGIELYGCSFTMTEATGAGNLRYLSYNGTLAPIWNCILHKTALFQCKADASNIFISDSSIGLNAPHIDSINNNFYIVDCGYGIYSVFPTNFTDFYFKGSTIKDFRIRKNVEYHAIDCVAEWSISWFAGGVTGKLYRDYTFNINVTAALNGTARENATVTIHNKNGLVGSWASFPNGSIPEQVLVMGYYPANSETLIDYNPYTLTISASGYATYEQTFTLSSTNQWEISLKPPVSEVDENMLFAGFILAFIFAFSIGIAISSKK